MSRPRFNPAKHPRGKDGKFKYSGAIGSTPRRGYHINRSTGQVRKPTKALTRGAQVKLGAAVALGGYGASKDFRNAAAAAGVGATPLAALAGAKGAAKVALVGNEVHHYRAVYSKKRILDPVARDKHDLNYAKRTKYISRAAGGLELASHAAVIGSVARSSLGPSVRATGKRKTFSNARGIAASPAKVRAVKPSRAGVYNITSLKGKRV